MRIVGGTARGRPLATPRAADVIRPTADRVRETLFNVLGQRCDGLSVLDLYAGTGALGLEAVSRGASAAVLVDRGREALTLCRDNARALGFAGQVEILASDALAAIAQLGRSGRSFELVFADPPYRLQVGEAVLTALTDAKLVPEGGVVVLEVGEDEVLPERSADFTRIDQRRFGATTVCLYRAG